MSWLSKKFEELTAQINPFDGGKTASTVRANRVQPPPAQTRSGLNVGVAKPQQNINIGVSAPVPKVSVAKPIPTPAIKVGDVSVAQSPTMTNKSESYQAPKLSNKIVDIGKSIGSGIVEAPKYLSTGIAESLAYNTDTQKNLRQAQANLQDINTKNIANASRIVNDPTVDIATKQRYAKLLDHQVQTADQNFNQANQRNQEIQQRTDPVKGGASVASLGLDVATLGVGAGATQLLKQAGKQGTKQLTTRLVKESAKTAGVGAGAGAISPFVSNGSDTGIKDVAIGAGLGAGIGGALPGVGYGLSKTIKPTTNLVKGAYKSFNSLGEDGFIQAGPTPKKIHPEDQAIMADFIDKSRGIYRPDERTAYQLDLDASRIAERYGIDPGVNKNINPVTRLADAFDSRLQTEGFGKPDIISKAKDVAKKIWPSDEGGGLDFGEIGKSIKKPKTGVNDAQLKEIQKAKKSVIDVATDEIYNNQPKDNLISQVLKNGGISSTAYETYPKGVIRSKGLSADRMAQVLGYPDENSLMDALNSATKPLTRKEIKESVIKDLESGSHPYSADYKQMLDAEVKRSDELSLYPKGTYREVKVNNKPPKSLSDEDFASLLAAGGNKTVYSAWQKGQHINHAWRIQPNSSVTTEVFRTLFGNDISQETINITSEQIATGKALVLWHEALRDQDSGRPESATKDKALVIVQALGYQALNDKNPDGLDNVRRLIS